jgi:tetratricopeptide (TPR) repeat protein
VEVADLHAPGALHNTLLALHRLCDDVGLVHAGREFAEEAVLQAEAAGRDSLLSEALVIRGRTQAQLGEVEAAEQSITRAIAVTAHIGAERETRAIYQLDLSQILAHTDPARALDIVDRVLALSQASGWTLLAERAQFVGATAEARLGRLDRAMQRLEQAAALRLARRSDAAESLPSADEAARREALEEIVLAGRRQGVPAEVSRRLAAHAREGDLAAIGAVEAASAPTAPSSGPGPVRVEYLVLPDRLLLWARYGGESELFEHPIEAQRLRVLVTRARELLSVPGGRSAAIVPLQELWEILVAPIEDSLAPTATLAVAA